MPHHDHPTVQLQLPLGRKHIIDVARALDLARQAGGEVIRLRRGELGVEMKAGNEPVTIADKRASDLIVDGLAASFPNDTIVTEERPAPAVIAGKRLWLVDPI